MLKRILLGLDDTPASVRAMGAAVSLARRHKARLTGLTIVDAERISPAEAVPLGGDSYKQHKDKVLVERTREHLSSLVTSFREECRAAQVECEAGLSEGDAIAALTAASDVHDLIAIGRDANFHSAYADGASGIVAQLLKENPRPVIVYSDAPEEQGPALIAYDGSVPSMRALQMFCLLGLAQGGATIASVHPEQSVAAARCARAAEYLRAHGVTVETLPEATACDPAGVLTDIAREAKARLIVMGAYGRRGWREWLLGSTADRLAGDSTAPLFIHH